MTNDGLPRKGLGTSRGSSSRSRCTNHSCSQSDHNGSQRWSFTVRTPHSKCVCLIGKAEWYILVFDVLLVPSVGVWNVAKEKPNIFYLRSLANFPVRERVSKGVVV